MVLIWSDICSQAEKEAERATKWAGMAQHAQLHGEDLHTFSVDSKVFFMKMQYKVSIDS